MQRIILTTLLLTLASQAHAEDRPGPAPEWVVATGGNLTMIDAGSSQSMVSFSLSRMMKKTSIGVSGMMTASADSSPVAVAPDHFGTIMLSAGQAFGRGTLVAHFSLGKGFFKNGGISGDEGQLARVDSKAHGLGAGLLGSIDIPLAKNLVFTPSVEVDYSKTILTKIPIDQGAMLGEIEDKSDGIALSGGGTLLRHFGKSRQHALMLTASVINSTNASDFIHRTGRVDITKMKYDSADTFVDYGANINFALSRHKTLNINAIRSGGYKGPESTVVGVGLQLAF